MKKTPLLISIAAILLSLVIFIIVSCSNKKNNPPSPDSFTITWKNYDGTVLETDNNTDKGVTPTYDGTTPIKVSDAQYTYSFSGWSPTIEEVKENKVYTAQFSSTINTYTVIWKNHDGTVLETDSATMYGITPTYDGVTPTKANDSELTYSFTGWSPAVGAIIGDTVYTAQYSSSTIQYTVAFDANGGNNVVSQAIDVGEKATKPANPVKDGYQFVDWYLGTEVWNFTNNSITSNITLKAKWEITTYTINYDLNGGSNSSSNPIDYTIVDTLTLQEASKVGHTFTGWTLAGNPVTSISSGSKGNITLVATWEVNTHQVVITNDTTMGSTSGSGSYTYGSNVTLNATPNDEHLFDGWYQGANKVADTNEYSFVLSDANVNLDTKYISKAQYFDDTFIYTSSEEGVTITGVKDSSVTELKVLDTFGGKDIIAVSNGAFKNCTALECLTLPFVGGSPSDNTYIGYLFGATNRTNISISVPSSLKKVVVTNVTSLGNDAFYGCDNLTSVVLPDNLTSLGSYAFYKCTSLSTISLGDKIESIGASAFYGCSSLTSLPSFDSLLTISGYVFYGCENLAAIDLGDKLESIGDRAFYNCSSLTSIVIPASVTNISKNTYVFSGCSSLTSVIVEEGNTIYDPSNGSNAIVETATKKLIYGFASTIIPEDVTIINNNAFNSCEGLTSISIPNSVVTIETAAFSNCTNLETVTLNNGLETIKAEAFSNCESLTSINIPASVKSIAFSAFIYDNELTTLTVDPNNTTFDSRNNCNGIIETATNKLVIGIPNTILVSSVTSIGRAAFSDFKELTSITIPDSVTAIDVYAFYNCINLETVTFGNNLESIGNKAFENCNKLVSLSLPNSLKTIGNESFKKCTSLETISFGNSIEAIGNNAFNSCTSLESLVIPATLTSISGTSFYSCSNLSSVVVAEGNTKYDSRNNCNALIDTANNSLILGSSSTIIPTGVTTIEASAFYGCKDLTSINLPEGLLTIKAWAFYNSGITSIVIPNSVTSIENNALNSCANLVSISVGSENTKYDSRNDCNALIDKATNVLLVGCKNTVIPDTIQVIQSSAFLGCTGLTSIVIPDSVTTIGSSAFTNCSGLVSVTLSSNLTKISSYLFNGCTSLTSITIPSSVTSIDGNTLSGCSNLESVVFEDTEGWSVGSSTNRISMTGLDNSSNNATLFTDTYKSMAWVKE